MRLKVIDHRGGEREEPLTPLPVVHAQRLPPPPEGGVDGRVELDFDTRGVNVVG